MAKKIKNKQVKQMMVSALSYQSDICNIFWDESVLWFDDSSADCEYVYQPLLSSVSITAMDHWLFLSNHKIGKESWQVTIK